MSGTGAPVEADKGTRGAAARGTGGTLRVMRRRDACEKAADKKLTAMAENKVNRKAA
jgi:hypothetical protein